MSKIQCLVGIENLKQDETKKALALGRLGMLPVDLWKRVLPAERVVLMRSVSKREGQKWSKWASLRRL